MAKERPWYDYLSELARGEHAVVDALFDIDPERAWYEHLYKPQKPPGERPTFENVLAREGMEEGWGRTGLGIAGGIGLDPLTYLTLGAIPAAKASTKAVQVGLRVPFVGKTTIPIASSKMAYRALKGGRRLMGALPGAETLSKLFVWAPKRLEKKFPGFLSAVRKMHGTESVETAAWMKVGQSMADEVVKIGKQLGMGADDVAKAVVTAVERPGAQKWAPAIEKLAATTKRLFAETLESERAVGLVSPALERGVEYFRRTPTRKGAEFLEEAGLKGAPDISRAIREHRPILTARRGEAFRFMTTPEANAEMAAKVGGDLFYAHPGIGIYSRGVKSASAKAQAEFLGDIAERFGTRVGKEFAPELTAKLPALKGVKLPVEIAEYANKMVQTLDSPEGSRQLLKSYDKILSIWKRWTLLPFPAYHMRNAISNIANNWLIGVDTPGSYSKAMDLLRGKDVRIGTTLWKNADLIDQFARNKVFGFGFMATEGKWVPQVAVKFGAEAPTAAGRIGRLVGDNKLLAVGAKIGNNIENWARAANAIHHMEKGFDIPRAGEQVARALFNYDEVPEFISKGAVRAMPFFRWSYFNWPYQLERLAHEPGKFAKMFKTVSAIGNRIQIPPGKMPRFIVEGMGVPISEEDGKQKYALMRNWLGSAEIGEMVKPITELVTKGVRPAFRAAMQPALERLTPLVKSPVEYYSNYSLYFQSEIERYPGEKTQFMGMTLTKHQASLLRNIRILNEFDRSFPWEAVGIDRRKRVDLGNLARAIRFATGVRLYPVEKKRLLSEEKWARIRELGLARRAVKIAEKQGFPEEVERTRKWYESLRPARKKRRALEF